MEYLNPAGWPRPRGYNHGVAAAGRLVFVAGQIGCDATGTLVAGGLVEQVRQAIANCLAVLAEAGAGPEHAVRMTWFVADRASYVAERPAIGEVYRELMGASYPAMSLYEVGLLEPGALVEIELTAVMPLQQARSGRRHAGRAFAHTAVRTTRGAGGGKLRRRIDTLYRRWSAQSSS